MTNVQKVIKYCALAFAIFLAVAIIVGICGSVFIVGNVVSGDKNVGEIRSYDVSADIHSLEINISAANFTVESADEFAVKSNLKSISVEEKNGTLFITEKKKINRLYDEAVLTLCVPDGTFFERVSITTGAGKFSVDSLSTQQLIFNLGAGDVNIKYLAVTSSADIEGGAGRITVLDGYINDLDLEMGAGQLNLTSSLTGDIEFELGVGESNITVKGNRDDYGLDIDKGLGTVTVDGEAVSSIDVNKNSRHVIEIDGGVGAINLDFLPGNTSYSF